MTTVADILLGARDLIAQPGGWCRGHFATDASGKFVDPLAADAASWCMVGAIYRIAGEGNGDQRDRAPIHLSSATGGASISVYNDAPGRRIADVVDTYNHAIARAVKEVR